jgi:hypothetical protein
MKAIPLFLFLCGFTLQAQITSIIPNLKLGERYVTVDLSKTQDTLIIEADEGELSKVSIIQRVSADKSIRTAPIAKLEHNKYRIPLHSYRIGAYTVEVHYKPHIYPFKMFRVKHIPIDMQLKPKIKSYRAVYGVVNGFSGHTAEIKALTKKRMDELILKFEIDKTTKTGNQNWLKVYAVHYDNSESLYYTIE